MEDCLCQSTTQQKLWYHDIKFIFKDVILDLPDGQGTMEYGIMKSLKQTWLNYIDVQKLQLTKCSLGYLSENTEPDMQSKSMDWFLHDRDIRYQRVNITIMKNWKFLERMIHSF